MTDVLAGGVSRTTVPPPPAAAQASRPAGGAAGSFKVVSDVVLAALLILLLVPVLLVLAIVVRVDGGPVLYRQTRVGRDGSTFRMLKFRSMVPDAERLRARIAALDEGAGPLFKVRTDPRVTRVGAVLRRYSLDELPQLFNVLGGSMSLVGPRPALPCEVAGYDEPTRRRLAVRPGMTGRWQVSGRSNLSWPESIALDVAYVEHWSLRLDAAILARTVGAVVRGVGAY